MAPHLRERRSGRVARSPQRARGDGRLEHGLGLRGLGPLARTRRERLLRGSRAETHATLPPPVGTDARRLHTGAREALCKPPQPPPEALRGAPCEPSPVDRTVANQARLPDCRSAPTRPVCSSSRLPLLEPAAPGHFFPAT